MLVFSKITEHSPFSSEGDNYALLPSRSYHNSSLPPNQQGLSDYLEHGLNDTFLADSPARDRNSRPLRPFSAYDRDSRISGSGAMPNHRRISMSLRNNGSHISVSSDNETSDCVRLLELRAEIEKLKCDNHGLQAGMETLSCVFYPILFSHHLQTISGAYDGLVVTLRNAINEVRDDIHKLVHHLATNVTGQIPGVESPGIPLNPKKKDYKFIKYWEQCLWQTI